ncbi:hypothetical protein BVRB_025600, partial [Beta vulgaris subsp. vulgaris]
MSIASDEPRSNSWGSWAWDLLAVPPDNNSVVDISMLIRFAFLKTNHMQ